MANVTVRQVPQPRREVVITLAEDEAARLMGLLWTMELVGRGDALYRQLEREGIRTEGGDQLGARQIVNG